MERIVRWRHLPALVFVVLVLVVALAGVALGGSGGGNTKTIKKIAAQQINRLAPGLSVAHATSADNATSAGNAANAADAQKVGGAEVCSRNLNVPADAEVHPLCVAGPLTRLGAVPQRELDDGGSHRGEQHADELVGLRNLDRREHGVGRRRAVSDTPPRDGR